MTMSAIYSPKMLSNPSPALLPSPLSHDLQTRCAVPWRRRGAARRYSLWSNLSYPTNSSFDLTRIFFCCKQILRRIWKLCFSDSTAILLALARSAPQVICWRRTGRHGIPDCLQYTTSRCGGITFSPSRTSYAHRKWNASDDGRR